MSSQGAQIQNLTRDVLGEKGAAEAQLVDMIADGCSYAALAAAEPANVPVARKLALLVRPALVAAPGKIFVWSDYSMIEARITAWLTMSEDAERVLDIFRAHDADPSRPDVYTMAAADVLHKGSQAVTPAERNIGKVVIWRLVSEGRSARSRTWRWPTASISIPMKHAASSMPGARRIHGLKNSGARTATAKAMGSGAPRCRPGRRRD
jgi:hypothetical protein